MKYLGILLTLLLALSVETSAQDNAFSKGGQGVTVVIPGQNLGACPDYKIIIVTPPMDVDFKMTVNTPAKNIDPGIVFKLCGESSQLTFAPQLILPNQKQVIMSNQETSDYLKGILLLSSRRKK